MQCFSVAVQSFTQFCVLRGKTNIYGGQISCIAIFCCCNAKFWGLLCKILHRHVFLLHSFVALQTLFVALFRAAFLHVKLHFFRKQHQPPTEGPGGVPEEPLRESGGSGRCPADNHESGLPRIMVTQGVPEGYGGVARLLEGLHEVLECPRWGSWQVPDCENF